MIEINKQTKCKQLLSVHPKTQIRRKEHEKKERLVIAKLFALHENANKVVVFRVTLYFFNKIVKTVPKIYKVISKILVRTSFLLDYFIKV